MRDNSSQYKSKRKRKEEKEEKVFLASFAKFFLTDPDHKVLTLLALKLLHSQSTALGQFAFGHKR